MYSLFEKGLDWKNDGDYYFIDEGFIQEFTYYAQCQH